MSCVSRLWLGWRVVGFLICACLGACERPDAAAPLDDDQPRAMPAPNRPMSALPVAHVTVNAKDATGPLEAWRQSLGHGGINSTPLPDRVVDGVAKLRPRLIRVFIQEFFAVYPEHGRFDWSKAFDPVSVEEMAFKPRRAAITASSIIAMVDVKEEFTCQVYCPADSVTMMVLEDGR